MGARLACLTGVCLGVAVPLGGCLAHPDFNGRDRLTDWTAYTLPARDFQAGVGLIGTGLDDIGASGRFEAGVVEGLQLGTNVVHDAFGIVNVAAKYAAPEVSRFTFAGGLGFKWTNPKVIWVLPRDQRDRLSDVNAFMVPVSVTASWAPLSWMGAHLRLGYTWLGIDGAVSSDDALFAGGGNEHDLYVQPTLTFYPLHGWAIVAGAQIPVYAYLEAGGQVATSPVPGVVVGGGAEAGRELDVRRKNTIYVATQLCWGKTNLRLSATYGLRVFEAQAGFLPAAEVFWRF